MARQELTQVGAFTSEVRDKIQTALQTAESRTPASSSAAGVAGQMCYDGTYLYLCVAANTWVRFTPTTTSF
jgi:hypothetical protein